MSLPSFRRNLISLRAVFFALFAAHLAVATGCGTTRWTDTQRTATEQLLVSNAIDRAVSQINFRPFAGQDVYLDTAYMGNATDKDYLISTLRQSMLASGCRLKEKREEAQYVIEARAGGVGTDRHDLLYGVPATQLPVIPVAPASPASIPEIPIAKRTSQTGVAKLAVFAYERESGKPVWQSGIAMETSRVKDFWLLGTGPFQKGTIYKGTKFAGEAFQPPLARGEDEEDDRRVSRVGLDEEVRFDPMLGRRPVTENHAATEPGAASAVAAKEAQPAPPIEDPNDTAVLPTDPELEEAFAAYRNYRELPSNSPRDESHFFGNGRRRDALRGDANYDAGPPGSYHAELDYPRPLKN